MIIRFYFVCGKFRHIFAENFYKRTISVHPHNLYEMLYLISFRSVFVWVNVVPSCCKKQKRNQIDFDSFLSSRCVADSNRRSWFCRPVTKPLIQRTMFYYFCASVSELRCKGSCLFSIDNAFSLFFFRKVRK